jgi:cytochrome c
MDSFELNKIIGAVLGCCLALLSLNILAGSLFAAHPPAKPGYNIVVTEAPAGGPAAPAAADEPLPKRLASADVARGEQSAKKCASCHTFDKNGRNLLGPNLRGIVGRAKGSMTGVSYSPAMKGQKGNWTLEDLDAYIQNPRAMVPGTAMAFPGIPKGSERADLLAYLNNLSDSPQPLPKAADAGPAPEQHAGVAPR